MASTASASKTQSAIAMQASAREYIPNFNLDEIKSWVYTRTYINDTAYKEQENDIISKGVIEPIIIMHTENGYIGIAGYIRYLIAKKHNMSISAIVIPTISELEQLDIVFSTNEHRQTMNDYDIAVLLKRYIEVGGLEIKAVAQRISKSTDYVMKYLRLLKDSEELREAVKRGEITEKQARDIRQLPKEKQKEVIEKVKGKTVAETKNIVASIEVEQKSKNIEREVLELEQRLSEIPEKRNRVAQLKQEKEVLELEMKNLSSKAKELDVAISEVFSVEVTIGNARRELEELKTQLNSFTKELEQIDIKTINQQLEESKKEADLVQAKINELKKQLDALYDTKAKLANKQGILKAQKSRYETLTRNILKTKEEIAKKEQMLTELTNKHADAIKNYEQNKAKVEQSKANGIYEKIKENTKKLDQLQSEINALNGFVANEKTWRTKLVQLKADLGLLKSGTKV